MITPLNDKILVRPLTQTEKIGSIFIPSNAKNPRTLITGKIVKLGTQNLTDDGNNTIPFTVKEGDKVLFQQGVGEELSIDGLPHLLLREAWISAIVDDTANIH